jgi:hypothetical protein
VVVGRAGAQEYKTRTVAELAREFFDTHREDGWFMDKCAAPQWPLWPITAAGDSDGFAGRPMRVCPCRQLSHCTRWLRLRGRRYHPDLQERKEKQRNDLAAVRARHFRQRVFEGVLPNLERAEADAGAASEAAPKSAADAAAIDVESAPSEVTPAALQHKLDPTGKFGACSHTHARRRRQMALLRAAARPLTCP